MYIKLKVSNDDVDRKIFVVARNEYNFFETLLINSVTRVNSSRIYS